MSILDTIRKGAVRIYGQGGSRRSSRIQWMNMPGSAYDYVTEAGLLYDNSVVLPAINWKANAISECELIIQQRDDKGNWERSIEKGAIKNCLDTIELPNEYYDGSSLWRGAQLSWDTRGHWFLIKRRDNLNRLIGFYWCPHFQMRPLADIDNVDGTKLITRFEYTPMNGALTHLLPTDVVMVRHGIDPKDWAAGLSPLAATLRDICSDNEVSNWLASILRNGAFPATILVPKGETEPPTPDQKKALKDLFSSYVRDRRGEPLVVPLPVDVHSPSWSPQQMELGALRGVPTARICGALGLDPMVLGFPSESKTYSNYEEAADAAGKRTILPTIRAWALQMGRQILPEFQLDPAQYRFWWDTSSVSWLQDETADLHQMVREDFKAGVIDRARAKELIGEAATPDDQGVYAQAKPEPTEDKQK